MGLALGNQRGGLATVRFDLPHEMEAFDDLPPALRSLMFGTATKFSAIECMQMLARGETSGWVMDKMSAVEAREFGAFAQQFEARHRRVLPALAAQSSILRPGYGARRRRVRGEPR